MNPSVKSYLITGALVVASFTLGSLSAVALAHPAAPSNVTMVGKAALVNTLSGPESAVLVALPSGATLEFNLAGNNYAALHRAALSSFDCKADGAK